MERWKTMEPETFWGDLKMFWDRITALAFERPEMMHALRTFLRDARSLDLGERFAPLHERMDMFQARIVRQGQRLGLVRDDVPLELLIPSSFEATRVGAALQARRSRVKIVRVAICNSRFAIPRAKRVLGRSRRRRR